MASVFRLPAVGDTMVEAEIVEWLVDVGDKVDLDQAICSIETDKSVVEMTTPYRGTVIALGGEPGDVVAVGEALFVVGEPGEEPPDLEAQPFPDPVETSAHGSQPPAGADTRSVRELSAEILRLAAAARDRTVAPDELSGATATVNNVGALGVLAGTPMLPAGTTMIAAFGMARPVVRLVGGAPVEVPTITVSATFDHRIIDGGASGRFLAQLKDTIETAAPDLVT